MCKYGARRALRYGDCNYEITEVQKHLIEVLEVAAKEVERVQREEAKFSEEVGKLGEPGTCREMSPELKHGASMISKEDSQKLEAAKPEDLSPLLDAMATVEVDSGMNYADQNINIDPLKSDYRLPEHWTHESKRRGIPPWKIVGSAEKSGPPPAKEQSGRENNWILTSIASFLIQSKSLVHCAESCGMQLILPTGV
ncbi:hypothetical protein EDB80DRAFT_783679 [Ilyonectria destructans]|nr:hypothetical protein EDB80DRAFT_783679 [Ilyonectria destructans]